MNSPLVVVKLKHRVEEHEDYNLGVPLKPIQLAKEAPKTGEVKYRLLTLLCMSWSFLDAMGGEF